MNTDQQTWYHYGCLQCLLYSGSKSDRLLGYELSLKHDPKPHQKKRMNAYYGGRLDMAVYLSSKRRRRG